MDERMLDAICERLKPALSTEGTFLVREGDPVNEMLFVIRGNLDSYTTNGGRTGFFNSCRIGPGDFCGEELLTWALEPRPSIILPSSTRTVKSISEVEAFALIAEDLKFVASQFRRLHSKQLRQKFRFYSPHWRTWAACFIQAAWRRFKRRKEAAELKAREHPVAAEPQPSFDRFDVVMPAAGSGLAVYAARLAASARRGPLKHSGSDSSVVSSLQKPAEPDFSVDEEWRKENFQMEHEVCMCEFGVCILCYLSYSEFGNISNWSAFNESVFFESVFKRITCQVFLQEAVQVFFQLYKSAF